MSFLGRMFGGKKGDKAPTPQEAIQRLRETEDMLTKKSDFLEKKIEQELATVKKHGTKNKRGNFNCLMKWYFHFQVLGVSNQRHFMSVHEYN